MPYTLTRKANHTIEISADLQPDAVEQERAGIVRTIRSKARVPGFRPGKAPAAAIQARYAEEIREELQEHLTGLLWREVFDGEDDLDPLTNPQISTLEFADDGGFRLVAELEVRPRYELPELDGIELPEHSLEVSDAEIEEELGKLQEEHAMWEPAEGESAADGMLVEADLYGEVEGSDDDPYAEEGAQFIIGSDSVPEEISEALQDAKVGDTRKASKALPDDLEDADKAGKDVNYRIEVKDLKQKVLPEVDDELATTVGLENLEELRERIREMLVQRKRSDRRNAWRRFLLDTLADGVNKDELPPSLVQSTVREQLDRYAYTVAMQGVDVDLDSMDWQQLAAKAEPAARQEVLDTLVLEQLAASWDVAVPEPEVDAYIATEAARTGVPPSEHKANLATEGRLDQIRHAARIAATVDEMIRRTGGEVD
jgi:trigger factor